MASTRDWEQMLKTGLEMKGMAQKFIDFAHMNGAGKGGEGEDDLEELPENDVEDSMADETDEGESPAMPSMKMGKMNERNPKAALLIAISKKRGKK